MAKQYVPRKPEEIPVDETTSTPNNGTALTGTLATLIGRLFGIAKAIKGTTNAYSPTPISLQALNDRAVVGTAPVNVNGSPGGSGTLGGGDITLAVGQATESGAGISRFATVAEVGAGSATDLSVHPSALKGELDTRIAGRDHKDSVKLATTGALPANTATTTTLTANANGAFPNQDGFALGVGESLLVKDESTASKNGWYTLTNAGSGSAPWVLTRRADADASAKVTPGAEVRVEQGTANAGKKFYLATSGTIVLGTTALSFLDAGAGGGGGFSTPAAVGTLGITKVSAAPDDAANPVAVSTTDPNYLDVQRKAHFSDRFADHVASGINPSVPGSGLSMTTPAGVAYANGRRVTPAAETSHAYTASRDTYVDLLDTGAYAYVEVSNNAAEPGVTSGAVRVLKVVTGASNVSSVEYRSRIATLKRARVQKNAAQSISSGVWTAVSWQVDADDPQDWHSTSTNPSRITAPEAGFFAAYGFFKWAASAAGSRGRRLAVNGTPINDGETMSYATFVDSTCARTFADLLVLNAGDYVELQVFQNVGVAINLDAATYLQLVKVF